mgnify:CR=1 FL=1
MLQPNEETYEQMIFQHDNAPYHRAKKVNEWFEAHEVETLKWPAYSPDLNCIENLWSWLDKQISKASPKSVDEIKDLVINLLNNVRIEIGHILVDSMPKRIELCIKNNGGTTKY